MAWFNMPTFHWSAPSRRMSPPTQGLSASCVVSTFNAATGHTHERSSVFRVARLCSPHARAITASSPICLRLRHVGRAGAGSGLREHAHTHTHARTQVHGRRRERERTTEGDAGERERERGGDRVSTSQHIGPYAWHATN